MKKKVNKNIFKYSYILFVLKLLTLIDSGCYGYGIKGTSQNNSITNNTQGLPNETDTNSTGMQNKHEVLYEFGWIGNPITRTATAGTAVFLTTLKSQLELTKMTEDINPNLVQTTRTRPSTIPNWNLPKATRPGSPAGAAAPGYIIETTKTRRRSTPPRYSFAEDCDYVAHYCLKAYKTGKLCARTLFHKYSTFDNYCMVDFINCVERYELWQIAHMGECYEPKTINEYVHYPYLDDYFLDQYLVAEM